MTGRALPVFALALALTQAPSAAAPALAADIEADIEACRTDPRFRIGGAAIGDCLMDLADIADEEIAAAVAAGEARYCFDEDRAAYRQTQTHWSAYRQIMCDLVERSPNNTPSWVSSAACRLELARQRLSSLRYTEEYGSPRCPPEE